MLSKQCGFRLSCSNWLEADHPFILNVTLISGMATGALTLGLLGTVRDYPGECKVNSHTAVRQL
jgi:hypothetical protein